jgi:zinc protease
MINNRELKPDPAEEYKFVVPDIQKIKLANGLTLLIVERPNLPIIRINLMVNCGSKYDPPGKKGLANLFSMCVDEGAGSLDALELSNEFDLLGSDFDVHCTSDTIYLLSRSLKENLERTIELFASVVLQPQLKEKDFLKEKSKVVTRILQTQDDPDEIASNAFEYILFNREHPYAFSSIGNEEGLDSITIQDVKDFYNRRFLPSDSNLIMVGDINPVEAERLANKYFSSWKGKAESHIIPSFTEMKYSGFYFIDKPGSVQCEIRIGHPTPKRTPSDYFNRLMLNLILGGQFSSRINLNLREKKGYTYGAFSNFNFYQDAGYFLVSTSVSAANTRNSVSEIMKELEFIREGVIEEELTFSKTSLMRKFPSNFETNGQIASSLSRLILYNLADDHFKKYLQLIHEISIDQVNKAAVDYIFPEKTLKIIVGNKEDILAQFNDGDLPTELDLNGDPFS